MTLKKEETNPLCLKCSLSCKQRIDVTIIFCFFMKGEDSSDDKVLPKKGADKSSVKVKKKESKSKPTVSPAKKKTSSSRTTNRKEKVKK